MYIIEKLIRFVFDDNLRRVFYSFPCKHMLLVLIRIVLPRQF